MKAFVIVALIAAPAHAARPLSPASDCAVIAAEAAELRVQHAAVKTAITDIALGRTRRKPPKPSAGDVGRAAAGTAASILLPFGIGALLGAGLGMTGKKKRGAAEPAPDVPAMIEAQAAIEERLAEIEAEGC